MKKNCQEIVDEEELNDLTKHSIEHGIKLREYSVEDWGDEYCVDPDHIREALIHYAFGDGPVQAKLDFTWSDIPDDFPIPFPVMYADKVGMAAAHITNWSDQSREDYLNDLGMGKPDD
ncbi:hypothetical protein [Natrinema sp. 1APR25-10V2]|uniref:hypothetical protein n=1 Tax=Natrinema sp. 1APR25-10V2 TaxID=2951081 RepID=UPI002876C9E9|nr:hypothetical protein [Natrinema sp. 1APR25-10V2]MDS0474339.1 hypothetical protein [Natrinema sp. 1APR25-10V2]